MAKLGLSSPWMIYYREVEALFQMDPGVRVIFDDDNRELKLYVEDGEKAYALSQLLPTEKRFGRVNLKISVIPANGSFVNRGKDPLVKLALDGNNAVSFIKTITGFLANDITFIVFKKEVVQYYTDNIGDYHGLHSTLYQDLAKDLFGEPDGIFFCTDNVDPDNLFIAPQGEWP